MDARYFDAPRHPLGIATHPAWASVRDRWNALYCDSLAPAPITQNTDRWAAVVVVAVAVLAAALWGAVQ